MSYIDLIKEKAKADRKTIVLPETNDKRTLIAAARIMQEKIADIIMVGNEEKIMDGARWLEVELDDVTVIDPEKYEKFDEYVQLLYETRKSKGMTLEKAEEILKTDYLTFGVIMVKANDADGMVAGACHATADTLRPALQILKTAPGVKLVSSGCAELRIWRKRNLPFCGLWSESGSYGGRTGRYCGNFCKEL